MLVWERPEPPDRPVPASLSRERIVRAAIRLADADGLAAVSLRKVAAALDVGPMRLYGYITTKEELLELMVDAVYAEIRPAGDGWREALSVVVAVGLRPCSGALVVLVFALSQGVLWAGIASVFLMGIGTAMTVAALATIAMFAKGTAQRLSGQRGRIAMRIVWWAELAAAFFVFAFGILLILANLYG